MRLRHLLVTAALLAAVFASSLMASRWGDWLEPAEPPRVAEAETDRGLITGALLPVVARVNGEALSCEQLRHMDEVEFITDDSYCG